MTEVFDTGSTGTDLLREDHERFSTKLEAAQKNGYVVLKDSGEEHTGERVAWLAMRQGTEHTTLSRRWMVRNYGKAYFHQEALVIPMDVLIGAIGGMPVEGE